MLSKNIPPIPRCGSRSRGEGHTVGFDPAGGATPWDRILRGGPQRGISFEFEYLGEFEFVFETALGYESRGRETCFDEKNCMQKISRYCPFKGMVSRDNLTLFCIFLRAPVSRPKMFSHLTSNSPTHLTQQRLNTTES
jgi:hypothetical protein